MTIKEIVDKLIRKYGTRDPIKIAAMMGILIQFRNLKGVLGYYQTYRRIPVIHVAMGLPETLIAFIVAHELAHRILHPNVNVPFLRANTFHSIDKIERQANQFAVDLLIPDELLLEGMSIYEAAEACGVPGEVAHLKTAPKRRT
ncbi:ImmA/IrrE family metallo-endopeptidase [Paenibacillus oceani]|uniref:ImmA/IrrE family metallo-endopeptidase n=1 Tax=Paenibacillus oceani TaxID=2772510 RepID=A0A927C7N2_9BACL|nr:ImmA/IrrE family metallo-endopeptidase [Paenibacillus oceani]MBD2861638.1 ImmA/IrrE family metallo-endopeptidase [Paenibacillus oceani]